MMTITDLNGKEITVEDLDLPRAIAVAEQYKNYHGKKGEHEGMHKRLKEYWTDVYQKLKALSDVKPLSEEENGNT